MTDAQGPYQNARQAVTGTRPPRQTNRTNQPQGRTNAVMGTYSSRQEYQRRLKNADRALRQKDPKNYTGTADREYQKELARSLRKNGQKNLTAANDAKIAAKLKAAGYSNNQIQQAIAKHSPLGVKGNQASKNAYAQRATQTGQGFLRNKTHDQFQRSRTQKGLGNERRLDKLGLAETAGLSPQQKAKINRWKATQEYAAKKGPKHKYTQAQKFRLAKAEQMDRNGVKKALTQDADIKASQRLIRNHPKNEDYNPNNQKFYKGVGRNSASKFANSTPKQQETYGRNVTAQAQKRNLDDQPNQRQERQKNLSRENRPVAPASSDKPKQPSQQEQLAAYHHHHSRSR